MVSTKTLQLLWKIQALISILCYYAIEHVNEFYGYILLGLGLLFLTGSLITYKSISVVSAMERVENAYDHPSFKSP